MTRIFLLTVCILITLKVNAQNDIKAKEMLEETSKKMQAFLSISASFTFSMENEKMNISEKNSGSLLLKGKKYNIKLPDMGMQIISDGLTVWNFMEDANQVTISNSGDENQDILDPTTIFNVYQEGYTYKFVEDKTVNGKLISYIDLIPLDKSKEYTKLTVGIEKTRLLVFSLVTQGKDGNLYGIYINELKPNQPIADAEFVFNRTKYPDVEVVDFR